ncbi:DUF4214 domain-containing protein [Pseudomonas simiae]|uniref:DUF4214 domain-containing protein n=1 Tax=Pseudomonas simiae TaxID=321846 RepID=UPI0018E7CA0C|nr:DUF4214 domain-containing protein [Pseudomonas simiae]MBJ2232508.1 DUF4214 domain-containing protein [Pseudomonas simiae]
MATQAQLAAVQQLYVGYLGRAADSAGQQFWANAIANGTATIASVATGFTLSAEYKAAYGGLTTDALVEKVYNNVLGRTPDAEGKAFWVAALASGKVTADTLVATIVTNLGALDQQTINNKVFVAQTYTDTAGANYNVAAGTASIVGVDSTAASVATAVAAISNGTLPGQVPGETAINNLATAQAAVITFEAANKATADALVAKIDAANKAAGVPLADTLTDNIVAATSSYAAKVAAVVADADLARGKIGGGATTTVLTTDASDKDIATKAAFEALSAGAKVQANTLVNAIAAEATAKAAGATAVQKAAVEAGLATDAPTLFGAGKYADGAAVYSAYVLGNKAARDAIDLQFKDSAYYATFKATVAKDAAYADAIKATSAAKNALDSNQADDSALTIGTVNGIIIKGTTDTAVGTGDAYISALNAKTTADATLAAAKAADVDVAAAKALKDAYAVPTKAVTDAQTAVDKVAVAGSVAVVKLDGTDQAGTGTVAAPIKDVFYFADKAVAADRTKDFKIDSFAAGDSIVLGNSTYTYNSGALSTGDNNKLEFFLVKSDSGMQVVLESTVAGSTNATTNATTGVVTPTVGATDTATVITLTGVTADHVTVANGVISYV